MHKNKNHPAPIKKDIRKRFYSAVVLLSAITGAYRLNRQPVAPPTAYTEVVSAEAQFRDFVNRLSQFCDVKAGGDSVTAFTVLDCQDHVQYRFACNKRNKSQLTRTAVFVKELLAALRESCGDDADEHGDGDVDLMILTKVLGNCRTRVHCYLGKFKEACRACACAATGDDDKKVLEGVFAKAAKEADFKSLPDQEFAHRCKTLMTLIEHSLKQPIFASRTRQTTMTESTSCWLELRHFAGRLLSYYTGTRTLLAVARACPRLVDEHAAVEFLRSSDPDDNPFQDQHQQIPTAEKLISDMININSSSTNSDEAKTLVQDARALALDEHIQAAIGNTATFRPLVHAELLVLQSLEKDGLAAHPSHFWGGWRYIGSSKPTCRLCSWYFAAHDGGFVARPTHGNLYVNWKAPDVCQRDGEAAIRERERILRDMVGPIRSEALRTLRDKMPLGKQFDSTTGMTTRGLGAAGANGEEDGDDDDDDMDTSFDDSEDVEVLLE